MALGEGFVPLLFFHRALREDDSGLGASVFEIEVDDAASALPIAIAGPAGDSAVGEFDAFVVSEVVVHVVVAAEDGFDPSRGSVGFEDGAHVGLEADFFPLSADGGFFLEEGFVLDGGDVLHDEDGVVVVGAFIGFQLGS